MSVYLPWRKMDKVLRIVLWFVMIFGGAAGGLYLDFRWFPALAANPVFHAISFVIGLGLTKLVLNSSRNTGRFLARLGREGDLPRLETNKLVTEGYYACMRHPMHLGLFLFPAAAAFLTGSISFILLIVPLEIIFMIMMIKLVEEPQAVKKFGKAYEQYRRQVPMFSLRRECLKNLFANTTEEQN